MLIMQQTTKKFATNKRILHIQKISHFYWILNSITILKGPKLAFRVKVNPVDAFRNTNK